MAVLLIVLVVLAVIGLYGTAMQLGWLGGGRERASWRSDGESWRERGEGRLTEWLEAVPRGCIVSLMVVMGIWIAAWLVFLIVGLNFLWSVR